MDIVIKNTDNLKKLQIISGLINNKIKNSRIIKKKFYNKFEKNNKINFTGMANGTDIKPIITLQKPFDKPILIEFKTNIDINYLIFELNNSNDKLNTNTIDDLKFDRSQNDLSIDDLVANINNYIYHVKNNQANIYNSFDILVMDTDIEKQQQQQNQIQFNNINKHKIIEWNLELKKFFCLIWKVLEKIHMEFDILKKNTLTNTNDNNIIELIKTETNSVNSNLRSNFSDFNRQINLMILLFVEIKNIFDLADKDNKLLSFETMETILDKYIFVLNYITENLSLLTN